MTARARTARRGLVISGLALVALVAAVTWSGLADSLVDFSHRRSLDTRAVGSHDLQRRLIELGWLHAVPQALPVASDDFEARPLERAVALEPPTRDQLAATYGVDQEWIDSGVPVVSLLLDPEDLRELQADPMARGPESERLGHFTYIEDGRVVQSGQVGVRIHGGVSRETGRYGYRIYFRRRLGPDHLLPEILDSGAGPVLQNEKGIHSWVLGIGSWQMFPGRLSRVTRSTRSCSR